MVLAGTQQSLEQALGIARGSIIFIASSDRLKLAQKLTEMQNGPAAKIAWPLLFMHLSSVATGLDAPEHAYNTKSFTRHGVYVKIDEGQLKARKVNLVPTVFEFEVVYMVDNFAAAFAFTNNWMAQSMNNRANFTVTYGNKGFDIRVKMASNMTTPDMEASVDQPNVFEYTSTIQVIGYSSDPHPDGESDVQLLRKPVVNVTIDDVEGLDPKVWSGRHVMPILKDNQ